MCESSRSERIGKNTIGGAGKDGFEVNRFRYSGSVKPRYLFVLGNLGFKLWKNGVDIRGLL